MRSSDASADRPDFDLIMASVDTRMIVVTTAAGGERAGCLVGFHAQSSVDPPRYTVWLSKANHTYRVALRASHVGVHFLTEGDVPLAEIFGTRTGDTTNKFAGLTVTEGPGGVPLLLGCANRFAARRIALLDEGGDHVCVVTEPVQTWASGRFAPLSLVHVRHLEPGHGTEERNNPPTERATTTPGSEARE